MPRGDIVYKSGELLKQIEKEKIERERKTKMFPADELNREGNMIDREIDNYVKPTVTNDRYAMPFCPGCRKYHREGHQFCENYPLTDAEIIATGKNRVKDSVRDVSRMPILEEREKTHGDFLLTAKVAQDIKNALDWAPKEQSVVVKEAAELIATKLARAFIGNSLEKEHWLDIQGYAGLVLEYIQKQKA